MADEPTTAEVKKTNALLSKIKETEEKALEDQIATHDEEEYIRKRNTRDRRKGIRDAKSQRALDQSVAENSAKIAELTEQVRTETAAAKEAVEETTEAVETQTEADKQEADLIKLRGERDKQKRDETKKEEMKFYQRLEQIGITDADIQDDMLRDFNKGLVFDNDQLEAQYENQQLIKERSAKDDQAKRD